jgi:uncharacterized membrane protein YfcA
MLEEITSEIWFYVVAGFVAQIIDGAMGMAYGVTASSLLIGFGVPPAITSATVHAAECFTTGTSGLSHHYFGNVDRRLFRTLIIPGVLGAVAGAYLLSSFSGDTVKPYVAGYLLLMGLIVTYKSFREFPPRKITKHLLPLGFGGAFMDAAGGGGWGPIVSSTLIARGSDIRITIGSVCAVEFFVALAASITFFIALGLTYWQIIAALAVGGIVAAPIGAYLCKRLPLRPFMFAVGLLIIALSVRTLLKSF